MVWSGAYLVVSRCSALAAVPVLLHELGVDLYAVWVLASTLVFAQGLVDFGCSAAVIRFVAVGKAQESRTAVLVALTRAAIFYGLLSVAAISLWVLAPAFADRLSYLSPDEADDAVVLLRYTVVTFGITNATLLLSAVLQGLDRVDSAYRARTVGAAVYLPLLVGGLQIFSPVEAAGASMLAMYGVELVVAGFATARELPRVGTAPGDPPPLKEMFHLGVRWQISSWADFATFQLPRIVAGAGTSSRIALLVDLALRYGQAITTPLSPSTPWCSRKPRRHGSRADGQR